MGDDVPEVLARIVEAGDHRFTAVLIQLLRMSQLRLRDDRFYNDEVIALERLTGRPFGSDWIRWAGWYGETTLEAPPGFADLKARSLARIDPGLGAFFEGSPAARVRVEEVVWGGGLPGPAGEAGAAKVPAASAASVAPDEAVLAVALGAAARAYPLRRLERSAALGDELGGVPIVVTWCAYCASGGAFRVGSQETRAGRRVFAPSGLVFRGVPLLFDEATRSLWDPLSGRALVGPEAGRERALEAVASVVTTWGAWAARHPESSVVAPPPDAESPYAKYLASDEVIFPVPAPAEDAPPERSLVFGLEVGLQSRAWRLEPLLEARVRRDRVAGRTVQIVANEPRVVARTAAGRDAPPWSPGAAVRAYEGPDVVLAPGDGADTLRDAEGHLWRVTEEALLGPGGARAPRLVGAVSYWFAWRVLHPDTTLWTGLD